MTIKELHEHCVLHAKELNLERAYVKDYNKGIIHKYTVNAGFIRR